MVSTQQIGLLGAELSTASGLPKAVSEQVIQRSLAEPSWVVPFNTSTFPLYVSGANSGIPMPSATQAVINYTATGTGAVTSDYTVTAGKSFALFGVSVIAGSRCQVYKTNGTTQIADAYGVATGSPDIISYVPIWIYTAGEIVKVNASGAATYNWWGIEYS